MSATLNLNQFMADFVAKASEAEAKGLVLEDLRRKQAYRSRSTKRGRRTGAEMHAIRQAIYRLLAQDHPMTCRQIFYRLVSSGVIQKTEAEYKATVIRLLGAMRWDGHIPFGWIADSTRWMRKPQTFTNLEQALRRTLEHYRRALWDNQFAYVEVWLEKDALAGVVVEVTSQWDVPLMVTRGYPSLTYLYEAAETIKAKAKPVYLYYLGDWDPSGLDISRTVEEGIRELAPNAEVYFERVAVTPEQINDWSLPTRPTKQSDTRSHRFQGESVEVDAIPPSTLRDLVEVCIIKHINADALEKLEVIEESERTIFQRIVAEVTR